jgi:predicted RND superfamily exporter protein
MPIVTGSLAGAIIKESSFAAILSLFAITLVLYVSFRSVKKVMLILLPITLGFVYTGGLMGAAGVDFNYINIGVVTLIFGIGVDYGVYMIQGYSRGGMQGVARSSRSVFMCALTSAVGFGSLMTMSFKGVASFGSIVVMGIAACVFAALVILPAMFSYIDKRSSL